MLLRVLSLIIVIGVLALGAYYYTNSQSLSSQADDVFTQNQKNQALVTQLNGTSQSLSADINQLQTQIAKAKVDVSNVSSVVPSRVNPNDLVQELLNQGQVAYVTIIPLSMGDWSSAKIGSTNYLKLDARIKVSGEMNNVTNYITSLQKSVYPTLSIQSISLQQSTDTPGNINADISLTLYSASAQ
jgi:Tfp pilus assembly protein PilO